MERINALNPNAQPWDPKLEKGKLEDRIIYFTFSHGQPLSKQQIHNFFTWNYGNYVENVYVHHGYQYHWTPPLFGKVTFSKCTIPALILGGQEERLFMINDKPLLCKKCKDKGA